LQTGNHIASALAAKYAPGLLTTISILTYYCKTQTPENLSSFGIGVLAFGTGLPHLYSTKNCFLSEICRFDTRADEDSNLAGETVSPEDFNVNFRII
jgi:hypothetical protein